ncbi:hypothetical protein [Jannaschia sp. LMIT008]|uniref:hypothetical protein n=1 Tax=Jannaschia maritima TaxID=3032585 RepID=UPI002810B8FF|nr:hypothetical protein [Jannaschia sp. LMIT008]
MQIADVLTRALVPLARLAIGRGLGVRDLLDPLKRAFLVAAETQGVRQTDSALALATGLQRRDVVRLRDMAVAPRIPSAPARLIARWPDAAVLPLRGGDDSFDALARSVRRDVHPRTLLDALVAAGSVTEEGDTVRLVRRAYAPGGGSPEQLLYLADNLHDHGAAAVSNVLADAGFFDRAAHFDGLDEAAASALAARFAAGQMAVLRDVAEAARGLQDASGDGAVRVRFGGYGYWTEGEER